MSGGTLKENTEKWTKELMAPGWVAFPTVILERQQALGLDPVDVNILLQIAKYWWFKDSLPFPSKKAIADCIGRTESTVRRRIAEMERDGLIKRKLRRSPKHGGQTSNEYSFDGLIKAATPYAIEAIQEKEKRKKEDAERRTRKNPRIKQIKE